MVKAISINEKYLEKLRNIKGDNKLKNESETIRFLIDYYMDAANKENEDDKLVQKIIEAYDEKYNSWLERVRWATQTTEMHTTLMLDVMNTQLTKNGEKDCVFFKTFQAEPLAKSMERYKDMIAHFKQKKDERNALKAKRSKK